MKSVSNRYRQNFRRIPSVMMESFTRLLTGKTMTKSTDNTPPKAKRISKPKTTPKAEAPLSEAAISAAIASVKAPAPPKTSKPRSTPAKSAVPRKKAVTAHVPPSQEMINKMIEEAAYFLAEKRHFAPGFEEQDWMQAKQQIMTQIEGSHPPLK